jgi:glucose-1-phosphatase
MASSRFMYFDLGNVLVTFDHEIAVTQLAALAAVDAQTIRSTIFHSDLQTRFETGLITGDEYTAEINACLGTRLEKPTVMEAVSAIFQPNTAILAALGKLKEAKIPIGILSNTCDAHWHWLLARGWPMLDRDWFQTIILSYEVKSMKPDAGIYEASERQAQCSGAHIFFTDDRADNIFAAAQRGWQTYQFGNVDELCAELDVWLDKSLPE